MREEEIAATSRNIQVSVLQWQWSPAETFLRNLQEDRKSKNMLLQTYIYVTMRIDLFNQRCTSRRTSRSIIEKHDRWIGWHYYWRQRYRSLVIQYTGKHTGIFVEKRKVNFKTWCSTTQKRQKPVTEMAHKSYSSPEPQCRSRWNENVVEAGFVFLLHKLLSIVSLVDWCARIRLNVRISLLEKKSATGSTQRSHKQSMKNKDDTIINHYEELIQS